MHTGERVSQKRVLLPSDLAETSERQLAKEKSEESGVALSIALFCRGCLKIRSVNWSLPSFEGTLCSSQ